MILSLAEKLLIFIKVWGAGRHPFRSQP
jgi:hypothetical protein